MSTDGPRWRNALSCAVLAALATGAVGTWWHVYYTTTGTGCHRGVLYLSVAWLVSQWMVIGYLYAYRNIPAFARWAMTLLILLANVWFIAAIFSLGTCGP